MDNTTIHIIERELDLIKLINYELGQLILSVHADRIAELENKKYISIGVIKNLME